MSMAVQALRGRKLALVSNRANPELTERVLSVIRPADLNYVVASGRRVQSLCESIAQGTLDAVLICNGFMSHVDVNVVIETCKKAGVPFVPCGKGRWAEMVQSINKHSSSLTPLLTRPTKLASTNNTPPPANDHTQNAWGNRESQGAGPLPVPIMPNPPPPIPQPIVLHQPPPVQSQPQMQQKKRGPSISAQTKWMTEQLVCVEHWVEQGVSDPQVLADLIFKRFGVRRTRSAVRENFAVHFNRTLEGRGSHRAHQLGLPADFAEVKERMFGAGATPEVLVEPVAPPPKREPKPPTAPKPEVRSQTSLEVRAGQGDGTLLIDMKGPQGAMVVETRRTFAEIVNWLMGMT